MLKLIKTIIFTVLFFFFTSSVKAEIIADVSGSLAYNLSKTKISNSTYNLNSEIKNSNNLFIKRLVIRKIFERYSSPLVETVDSFIDVCTIYDLDCYLLPSIAGVESTFGRFIYPNSYNPFGWGGGYIMFSHWSFAIDTVGKGLRNNYLNRGAKEIEAIGRIYAESPTWAVKVRYFINQFEEEEKNLRLFFEKNTVKL